MSIQDMLREVPPEPKPLRMEFGTLLFTDAMRLEQLERRDALLRVAEAALREARDYIEANGGGWCRDGVTAPEVMRDIDAVIEAMGK